jgi:hypothetical protein
VKRLLFIALVLLAAFLAVSITGFYPAAIIDGSIITRRTWRKLEDASKRFANVERARRGERVLNFAAAENSALLIEGRRTTLNGLIEGLLVAEEGRRLLTDFDAQSEQKMREALGRAPNFKKAVESLYGISYEDFKELVLLPQAREEALAEIFEARDINFGEWLRGRKRQAKVRLYFTGFRWDGDRVE